MPKTPLEMLNLERSIKELQRDEAVLGKYADKGFTTINHAMSWLSGEIHCLEQELYDGEE